MAVANLLQTASAPNITPSKSAVRNPTSYSYGSMAVMTSPAFDKSTLDLKAAAMAMDTEANGVHDTAREDDRLDTDAADNLAQPKASVNGNHTTEDTSAPAPAVEPAIEPTTQASSGIDGVAQYMPDSQQDTNSLFGDSDMGATSVGHALEAPTSDVREEPATAEELSTAQAASNESTQQVPETQILPKEETSQDPLFDAMDTSADALADVKSAESSAPPTKPMNDLSIQTNSDPATTQPTSQSPAIVDREMEDAPSSGKVRPREDDEDDVPEAKRTKTEDGPMSQADFKVPEVPAHPEQTNGNGVPSAPSSNSAQEPSGVHNAVDFEEWPSTPMTNAQNKFLLERIRNTKKIKVSLAFKDPVDHIALGIPTYPDIVTKPMDLSTMEHKLKENKYTYVREFMADLDQMIENSELFNNKQHPVTQAGYNLRAYFLKGMGKMPRGGVEDPAKPVKAKKPTVNTAPKPRRESRVAPPPVRSPAVPTPTTAASSGAWPLQDGVPVIRRDSSSALDRPKREIHRPSKDLPYSSAKPRKKKYQQELKFCESVLAELLKPKYAAVAFPFITPVDPVALNIPSYLTIIKKPMDFGTIEKNLKNGAYQSAKDFHKDALLVFQNCYKFNPEGDAVNKLGHQFEEIFEKLWSEKDDWLAQHAPAPEQSPDPYSDEEDEEEDEEEVDPAQAQFLAIQQQIAQLNETAQALLQQQKGAKRSSPKASSKKKKAAAPKRKASLPLSVPPPVSKSGGSSRSKSRPKPPQPLTFHQKQEISEGISTLGDADMRKAVQIIRNGCPHLANVHDDEMELDMDEINDDTLRELFKFIKSIRGPKGGAVADDDFEPPRQISKQTTSRPKKNKPMGKTEQEDNMRKIQEKLQSFQGGASGSSQSPVAHDDASSDDDESSGSESEEE